MSEAPLYTRASLEWRPPPATLPEEATPWNITAGKEAPPWNFTWGPSALEGVAALCEERGLEVHNP